MNDFKEIMSACRQQVMADMDAATQKAQLGQQMCRVFAAAIEAKELIDNFEARKAAAEKVAIDAEGKAASARQEVSSLESQRDNLQAEVNDLTAERSGLQTEVTAARQTIAEG